MWMRMIMVEGWKCQRCGHVNGWTFSHCQHKRASGNICKHERSTNFDKPGQTGTGWVVKTTANEKITSMNLRSPFVRWDTVKLQVVRGDEFRMAHLPDVLFVVASTSPGGTLIYAYPEDDPKALVCLRKNVPRGFITVEGHRDLPRLLSRY
jgi:hypothetical protein